MCPDPQILSIYLDGELPSPWREKMQDHFSQCSVCREKLENFRRLQELFKKDTHIRRTLTKNVIDESGSEKPYTEEALTESMEEAKNRIWNKIESKRRFTPRYNLWHRRLSIPLPAAAAAAIIIMLFAVMGARRTGDDIALRQIGPAERTNIFLTDAFFSDDDIPMIPAAADMNGMLQYLNPGGANIIILQLPENKSFSGAGEPALIRAADYSSRIRGPGRQP
jgi:hypothetical protein